MMRRRKRATLLFLLAWPWAAAHSQWKPEGIESEFGIPASIDRGTEIRIWLFRGVLWPWALYRIRELDGTVSVEQFAWSEVTHETENLYTANQAARQTKKSQRFLEKHHCAGSPTVSSSYIWCRVPMRRDDSWPILFKDLLPDELWSLPEELDRPCASRMEDGESIGIEIMTADRRHGVAYGNPEFCCPHRACAIATHVRDVVQSLVH